MRFIYLLKKKRFYIFLLFLVIVYFFTDSYFDESVMQYVSVNTQAYFESMVNQTLKDEILNSIDGNFIVVVTDSNDKVSHAYMDAHKALTVRTTAASKIEELMSDINSKEKITNMEIPLGYFFTKIYFFSNGLKVPVKLKCYQAYQVTLDTTIKEYGINSSLFEIHLLISLETYVQIPFQRKRITLTSDILLSVEIINAEVPNFYMYGE